MPSVAKEIQRLAAALPEGAAICPGTCLHLGTRAAVDQALSRLARSGRLMRICYGVYMRPIETRYGVRPPSTGKVIESLAALWGDVIVPSGGSAANYLGLTTQVPVRLVLLTSGPDRTLQLAGRTIVLRHAPRWLLVAPGRLAGMVVRALAWMGPNEVDEALTRLAPRIGPQDIKELAGLRAVLPSWIAKQVSRMVAHAQACIPILVGQ